MGRLLLVLALLGLLAGCSTISTFVHTTSVLEDAGYDDVAINLHTDGRSERLDVSYEGVDDAAEPSRARSAALILWEELELYFDEVVFFVHGSASYENGTLRFDRTELIGMFGPRPSDVQERHLDKEFVKVGKAFAISAAVGLALLVGIGVIVAVTLRRRRRRRGWAAPSGYDPTNPWSPPAHLVAGPPPRYDVVPGDPNDPWAAPPR